VTAQSPGRVHWQLPDKALACGAEHLETTRSDDFRQCCRRDLVAVSCLSCLTMAAAGGGVAAAFRPAQDVTVAGGVL
jgi:hypothetical protein